MYTLPNVVGNEIEDCSPQLSSLQPRDVPGSGQPDPGQAAIIVSTPTPPHVANVVVRVCVAVQANHTSLCMGEVQEACGEPSVAVVLSTAYVP
jgi:hypothetical protein